MTAKRLQSLDQLRGYAIFGMILVNLLGLFQVIPWMLKHHHEGMSYADTIAPLFVFVVGIGFRMSVTRGYDKEGQTATRRRMLRRYLVITALGLLYGGFDWEVSIWDALLDIGCAGLLCMPFIGGSAFKRVLAAAVYLVAYQLLFSLTPYGAWTMAHSINGGPLGPMPYAFVLLAGSFVPGLLALQRPTQVIGRSLALAALLSLAGWGLRLEWPGLKAEWPFSQYAMTAPYVLHSTGLAFLAFAAFYLLCDVAKLRIPQLSILGQNPLVIYILQAILVVVTGETVPESAPLWMALLSFAAVYATCYAVAWGMHRRGIIVKI